ncbi:SDR family oxidoreductase [Nocardioides sp.]|uniref:SDR family oxidoreductase n=1 Tax=Nocardioides sp. TaxID=35761 RepID=UPI00321B9609
MLRADAPDLDAAGQLPWGVLDGRTIIMSGGLRGVGLAMAASACQQGANVVILTRPLAEKVGGPPVVERVAIPGGEAIAVHGDIRREADVQVAVQTAVDHFGGIDVCVNIASVLALTGTEALSTETFDLMHQVNVRGAFLLTRACIGLLRNSDHAHILTISPPLNMSERWLGAHPGYTSSKYGMTILGLGWAAELMEAGIASNCLWPQSTIATPGSQTLLAGEVGARSRRPEVMGDAAMEILSRPPSAVTGRCFLDVDVLHQAGIDDLSGYGGGARPDLDLFVDA